MFALVQLLLALNGPWLCLRPGVCQAEFPMATRGSLAAVRVVAVRLDPTLVDFNLQSATRDEGLRGAWSVDQIPADGLVAFNAGQFSGGFPWGWLVRDGVEQQEPGAGPLSMAFVIDTAGRASLVTPDEIASVRGGVRTAFQSYPAVLLADGKLPWELQAAGRGVDLEHRDSRLALCTLKDGQVMIALTRFKGRAGKVGSLPYGPTVVEMATTMRSLGCERAMLLDGGISSQLAVRGSKGQLTKWTNWRQVPLGLVVTAR